MSFNVLRDVNLKRHSNLPVPQPHQCCTTTFTITHRSNKYDFTHSVNPLISPRGAYEIIDGCEWPFTKGRHFIETTLVNNVEQNYKKKITLAKVLLCEFGLIAQVQRQVIDKCFQ